MYLRILTFAVVSSIVSFAQAESVVSLNRKPGLWSLEVTVDGNKGPGVTKQCVDASTDARMMQLASQSASQGCSKNELVKNSDGYTFHAECLISGSTMKSLGTFKGDFGSKYTGDVETTFDPPLFGKSSSKTTISATWLGSCPSDMKPGDIAMPNGMKVGMAQAEAGAKMASQMMKNPELAKALKEGIDKVSALQDGMEKIANGSK